MKKLNITKEAFNKSKYFQDKYGKLEYVSESGKIYKTSKGQVIKFVKESSDLLPAEPKMKISELISRLQEIMDKEGDMDIEFMIGGDRYTDEYTLVAGKNKIVGCSYFHEVPSW